MWCKDDDPVDGGLTGFRIFRVADDSVLLADDLCDAVRELERWILDLRRLRLSLAAAEAVTSTTP